MKKWNKRFMLCLCMILCLCLGGCANAFAKADYNHVDKIQKSDHYAKKISVYNQIEHGATLTAKQFDGWETLWKESVDKETEIEVSVEMHLTAGTGKIVCIDAKGEMQTILESSGEEGFSEETTVNISLQSGANQFKMVGYDCKDLDVKIQLQ